MSPDRQFWWNWWVNFGVALGTFGAVLVALFGDAIRARFFPPRLQLSLLSPGGEKTKVGVKRSTQSGIQEFFQDARFYHVRVVNRARWPAANQVQVFLISIEEPGAGDEPKVTWSGEVPIRWRHQEISPISRTVGPAADCDLFSIVKEDRLELHPLILPLNLEVQRKGKVEMVVSLQVRSNEGESPVSRFKICWDGKWNDGDKEMLNHLAVKQIWP